MIKEKFNIRFAFINFFIVIFVLLLFQNYKIKSDQIEDKYGFLKSLNDTLLNEFKEWRRDSTGCLWIRNDFNKSAFLYRLGLKNLNIEEVLYYFGQPIDYKIGIPILFPMISDTQTICDILIYPITSYCDTMKNMIAIETNYVLSIKFYSDSKKIIDFGFFDKNIVDRIKIFKNK
jgi:hypothetical protein